MPWLKAPRNASSFHPKGLLVDFGSMQLPQLLHNSASKSCHDSYSTATPTDTFTKLTVLRVEGYFFHKYATNIFSKKRKVIIKVDDISFVDLESLKLGEAGRNHVAGPSTSL